MKVNSDMDGQPYTAEMKPGRLIHFLIAATKWSDPYNTYHIDDVIMANYIILPTSSVPPDSLSSFILTGTDAECMYMS